jgi:hypothetical protein
MHMRFSTITGAQSKVGAVLDFIEESLREQVEAIPGNEGLATFAAADYGVTIALSYWTDGDAMELSEQPLAPLALQAAAVGAGALTQERYAVGAGYRRSTPTEGAVVEFSRFEFDPARVSQMIELFSVDSLPSFKAAHGLCTAQLLLDHGAGVGMIASAWTNELAARAFWIPAGELRAAAAHQVPMTFTGSEFYRVRRCHWAENALRVGNTGYAMTG